MRKNEKNNAHIMAASSFGWLRSGENEWRNRRIKSGGGGGING